MTRVLGTPDDGEEIALDADAVAAFFRTRAERIDDLGPTRAVIYQDKHPDLAERRDVREKEVLLPVLELDGTQRLLDVGCGTGRWVEALAPHLAHYHGADFAEGLVAHARDHHARDGVRFTVAGADAISLAVLGETEPFDRVLVAGVLIYLNHDAVRHTLACVRDVTRPGGLALFREVVAQGERLTIKDHPSEELEQDYHALYRTRPELQALFAAELADHGWVLEQQRPLFDDDTLNNRTETRQEIFCWRAPGAAR